MLFTLESTIIQKSSSPDSCKARYEAFDNDTAHSRVTQTAALLASWKFESVNPDFKRLARLDVVVILI